MGMNLSQPTHSTSVINSLVQSSSIMRKLMEHVILSVSKDDLNPELGIDIQPPENTESYVLVMAPGQEVAKSIPYPEDKSSVKLRLNLVPKEVKYPVQLDALLPESVLASKLDQAIEEALVEFITKEDICFFNNLYEIRHLINSSPVSITHENLYSECKRIKERVGVHPSTAYIFTDVESESNTILDLVVNALPKSVAISTLPIECLGLEKDRSVVIMLPPPDVLGKMYSSMLPTLDVSEETNHVYSGKIITATVLDCSVMILPDIKVVSVLS